MKIGDRVVGAGKAYIIAEIGNNHNGCLDRAIQMVDCIADFGADCAKFQMRNIKEVYRSRTLEKSGEDLGTEYIIDLLNRFELTIEQHNKLAQHCKSKGVQYLCTPWDKTSVEALMSIGVPAFKVASADLTNLPLLEVLVATNLPLILSTGMSTVEEIKITKAFLDEHRATFAFLHCNSAYPAPFHDINLKWMTKLKAIHPLVGYSGHERGTSVSLAAIALGANIIERHFTLDRNMEGPDHAASLTVDEFQHLVRGVREIEMSLGTGVERFVSQGEMINRENLGKSLVANHDMKKGDVISAGGIAVKSPGQGLSPQRISHLVGVTLQRDVKKDDYFFESDLFGRLSVAAEYKFDRPWGIPVRYHDFRVFSGLIKPDLWEFHLSYSDMALDPSEYLNGVYDCEFVVHAPELFANSHLMDLASPDAEYRKKSIELTNDVIAITRSLHRYFPKTNSPKIVANIGGFSMDENIDAVEKNIRYEIFASSLAALDLKDVELIPQTMAPFPWHFGGQRYQNLFVEADEITHWCNELKLRMCFDISHSKLTCNNFGQDFFAFAEKIAPFTTHIHMGDARGLNGEGLQIGDGEIDFQKLSTILREGCAEASFIPEIWQGHKNNGEGFWVALKGLEQYL